MKKDNKEFRKICTCEKQTKQCRQNVGFKKSPVKKKSVKLYKIRGLKKNNDKKKYIY
jgi:hypothetical protein